MPHSLWSTGCADLRQLAVVLKRLRPFLIPQRVVRLDLQLRIVAELIRIPDLVGHQVQLLLRPRLGRWRHPVKLVDIAAHRRFDIAHHLHHLGLAVAGKYCSTYTLPSASPSAPFTEFEHRFQRAACSGCPFSLRP